MMKGKESRKSIIGIGWEYMNGQDYQFHPKNVPRIVQLLCNAVVRLGGFDTEGIFRLAGNVEKVEMARKKFRARLQRYYEKWGCQ